MFGIRGRDRVEGRAVFRLLLDLCRGGKTERHVDAGFRLEARTHLCERLCEIGRGRHHDFVTLRRLPGSRGQGDENHCEQHRTARALYRIHTHVAFILHVAE